MCCYTLLFRYSGSNYLWDLGKLAYFHVRANSIIDSQAKPKNKGKPPVKVDLPYFVAGSRIELPTSGL